MELTRHVPPRTASREPGLTVPELHVSTFRKFVECCAPCGSCSGRERSLRVVLALLVGVTLTSATSSAAATFQDSQASAHIGERATIEGVVKGPFVTVNHSQFLDFGGTYPDQDFSAVIWAPDAAQFEGVSSYLGKRVVVTGKITLYRGKPEMELTSGDDLKVLP